MTLIPSTSHNGLQTTVVDLTAAQVATLGSFPVTVVPAPGATGALWLVSAIAQYDPGTVAFATDEPLALSIGAGSWDSGTLLLSGLSDSLSTFGLGFAQSPGADTALTVSADGDPGGLGAILTSSLADGGSLWAPADTASVNDGTGGLVTVSTVTNSFAVSAVSQGAKTFTVVGDASAIAGTDSLTVYRSTGNDGTYTAVSAVFAAGHTVVTVVEAIPSAVADGRLGDATAGTVGVLATYALTTPGSGYTVAAHDLTAVAPSVGSPGQINVQTITLQSDGTVRLTVLYSTAALA